MKKETLEQETCNFCGKTLREQVEGCSEITCYRQFLHKQETLEEIAEKWCKKNGCGYGGIISMAFIAGAKFQEEQHKITTDDAYCCGFESGVNQQNETLKEAILLLKTTTEYEVCEEFKNKVDKLENNE